MRDPLRYHREHQQTTTGAFGGDRFGVLAERFARFFGTSKFIVGQTVIIIIWIALNGIGIIDGWDPYPFILLNLVFSTQAAYAAPLILLAQTRQADRDKASTLADAQHREEIANTQTELLTENTDITRKVEANTATLDEVVGHVQALVTHFRVPAGAYSPQYDAIAAKWGRTQVTTTSTPSSAISPSQD